MILGEAGELPVALQRMKGVDARLEAASEPPDEVTLCLAALSRILVEVHGSSDETHGLCQSIRALPMTAICQDLAVMDAWHGCGSYRRVPRISYTGLRKSETCSTGRTR